MKEIMIAFYKIDNANADWTDKLIGTWTRSEYSHVELIINRSQYSSSPVDGKIRKTDHNFNKDIWDYYKIECDIDKVLKFYEMTKDAKYDWLGIFGFILPIKDRTNEFFCSEWCTKALQLGGVEYIWKLEPSVTSPGNLYRAIKDYVEKV